MKNFNTNAGAGNTHAQTEQKQYVTGVILHKLSGQKTDYQLHVNTTNPKEFTDEELLTLPEVIKALEAKNVSLTEKQIVSVETYVSTVLKGNAISYIFNLYFNAPSGNELRTELAKTLLENEKAEAELKDKVNAMGESEKEAFRNKLDNMIAASNEDLQRMQVNKAEVFIDANGSLKITIKEAFKSPYYPELTTDVICVYSEQLSNEYIASELMDAVGYNPNLFQLLSFIAHEGGDADYNEYSIYLMRL